MQKHRTSPLLGRLSRLGKPAEIDPHSISASIETGALDNECLQSGRIDGVTLVEIDGTYHLAVQTRVEEPFRILQLGPFWKRQPHSVFEGLAYADDAVVGPDGHPLGAGGLLPLHLFDYARVGAPDHSPKLAQPLTPPAGGLPDDGIDLLGRGWVVHAGALSHAARAFGLAIKTRLKSIGTVCTTLPETTLELIDRAS